MCEGSPRGFCRYLIFVEIRRLPYGRADPSLGELFYTLPITTSNFSDIVDDMTTNFDGTFAKLVPRNYMVRVSFSEAYNYVNENNTVHLSFMERGDNKPIRESSEPVEESTEYETYPDTDTGTADPRIEKTISNLGHFVLSLDSTRAPAIPRLGWRAGRGSSQQTDRGVDLLLARPRAISSKSLASVHMRFRFNDRSGFLMLMGGSDKVPVEVKVSNYQLDLGEQLLLYQSTTVLRGWLVRI